MGLYSLLFENNGSSELLNNSVINISNEIWVCFLQELLKWNDEEIYAISFFVD